MGLVIGFNDCFFILRYLIAFLRYFFTLLKNFSRYNGDGRRRRAADGISDFSCAEVPDSQDCYHILVYIPDLVVALNTWYLF